MFKYFADVTTAEEAKARYRELCRTNHPDISKRPDANAIMAEINAEWEKVWERLKDIHQTAEGKTYTETRDEYKSTETAGEFAEIIGKLVTLTGVTVELVGSWIWVTGNTYIHRDTLKGLGFGWAGKKCHRRISISDNARFKVHYAVKRTFLHREGTSFWI